MSDWWVLLFAAVVTTSLFTPIILSDWRQMRQNKINRVVERLLR